MITVRRLWVPMLAAVLLGMLLAVALAGPLGVSGTAQAAVEPRTTVTRTITVAPGAFSPHLDGTDYFNDIGELRIDSGAGSSAAPLFFEAPVVRVGKITLYARDQNAARDVCVYLYRTVAAAADLEVMGRVCSSGSGPGVRVFTERSPDYRTIGANYGPVLYSSLPGTLAEGYSLIGVKLTYSCDTAG